MNILHHVNLLQIKAKTTGNYRATSEEAGLSYQWLAKFAQGKLPNPTVSNIAKLEVFFESKKSLPPR